MECKRAVSSFQFLVENKTTDKTKMEKDFILLDLCFIRG